MDRTQEILGNVVTYTKYAKYLPEFKRRETWEEIIERYINMLVKKYPSLEDEIHDNSSYLYKKKVLPSMRALQFAGPAIEKNEARLYNCSYMPMTDYRAFSELMFLLLGGTGVGYSVQKHHVEKLPEIRKPLKTSKYLIGDSIEGWADAVKQLMKAYFGMTKVAPRFDYSDIRPKGSRLITAGGKAPGPEPLRICLTKIESILHEKEDGTNLTTKEVHSISCLIADAVLAGGIRRAALIALFSFDDISMATCKHGEWWELNPHFGRANNSAVILRNRVEEDEFQTLWQMTVDSNSGEPGIYFTNDPEYGTNPCCEISLRPYTFCNLTEINAGTVGDIKASEDEDIKLALDYPNKDFNPMDNKAVDFRQADFNNRAKVAAFFGTLQAGFTDFHYLRPIWKINTEKDALIGVGITGICNGNLDDLSFTETVDIVKEENERIAGIIGINKAARTTTIKPSGTTSCVVGTSSGIHAWHGEKYIRNIQCRVGDHLFKFFTEHHPELIKVMDYDPNSAVIGIPQIAPKTALLRENENALEMLERVKRYNLEWVKAGHRRGPNTNNVSATVSVDKDSLYCRHAVMEDKKIISEGYAHISTWPAEMLKPMGLETFNEWDIVGEWLWKNKHTYNGLSVLPMDGGTYRDAPFELVSEEVFQTKLDYILNNHIDLTLIVEEEDNTTQKDAAACAGGACEIV